MRRHVCSILVALVFAAPLLAQPAELKGHKALVYSVAFSPNGKILATASFDNTIKLWAYPSGKELRTLTGHKSAVYCVAFSPDGKTLASASQAFSGTVASVLDGGQYIR